MQEFESNPGRRLQEVRSGTTLLVADGEHRVVARFIPEASRSDSPAIYRSGRRLKKKARPKACLRGGGSMADIVRENRR